MEKSKFKLAITQSLILKAKNIYSEDNLVFGVPIFIARHFNAYSFMEVDIDRVLKYCYELKTNNSDLVRSALTYSAITLYAKCFMDASKGKAPKLEANQVFKNQFNIDIHNYLMELRHKFLVHRNDNEAEIEATFFLVAKGDSNKTAVQHLASKQIAFRSDKLEEIIEHLLEMNVIITAKRERAAAKVQKAMLGLDPKIVQMMLINNLNVD